MMEVERDDDGDLVFRGITPLHADTLMQMPEWLESSEPRVRQRLLPVVYSDPEAEKEWRRHGVEELEHLFSSRAEILTSDLESLMPDGTVTFRLVIRQEHGTAWLSSLNAARLALFELHELEEADMECEPAELGDFQKELALVRIHVLAFMQELLIEAGV